MVSLSSLFFPLFAVNGTSSSSFFHLRTFFFLLSLWAGWSGSRHPPPPSSPSAAKGKEEEGNTLHGGSERPFKPSSPPLLLCSPQPPTPPENKKKVKKCFLLSVAPDAMHVRRDVCVWVCVCVLFPPSLQDNGNRRLFLRLLLRLLLLPRGLAVSRDGVIRQLLLSPLPLASRVVLTRARVWQKSCRIRRCQNSEQTPLSPASPPPPPPFY